MECLRLQKIGQDRSTSLVIKSRQPIGDMMDRPEKIERIAGYVQRGNRIRRVSLVSKSPLFTWNEGYFRGFDPVGEYCFIWEALARNGIPVVPTLRRVSDTEVMMTDLSATGGCLYDKHSALDLAYQQRRVQPTDAIFKQLDLKKVRQSAQGIIDNATALRITLPEDDPLNLVVYPDTNWRLVVLDIGLTKLLSFTAAKDNADILDGFMYTLQYMQAQIRY